MPSRLICKLASLTIGMWILIPARLTLAAQAQDRCNSDFIQSSWALLKDARWGFSRFEQAAFVVHEIDGRTDFVRWPFGGYDFRAAYRGTIPPNAVAIVHTHPNGRPQPSDNDVAVARRLGIPVYVVTRMRVSVTTGGEVKIIAIGDWNPERCK
jgi:JAB domain-containing protein similar to deubiquitination enzymes